MKDNNKDQKRVTASFEQDTYKVLFDFCNKNQLSISSGVRLLVIDALGSNPNITVGIKRN